MDLVKEIKELQNQLAYSKNIGFFFGAGTSCSLGLPTIETLTAEIEKELTGDIKTNFGIVKDNLKASLGKDVNVEEILNQIRRIREITNDKADQDFIKVSGKASKDLDKEVCSKIYDIIEKLEATADLSIPTRFFAWLNRLNHEFSKEIFTTNYDLIIEKSLEQFQIPYFDGFVGSYEPFFWEESIERIAGKSDMTKNWIRLWKIHGSLSWFWKDGKAGSSPKIIRVGKFDLANADDKELVIYPSKEKYDSSRKQPFIAYFDRLKNYLLDGELLFIFTGYSFSDQHINEIICNCLRQNNRLSALVFFYKDEEVENLHKLASSYMNLTAFGPKKAMINGNLSEWAFPELDDYKTTGKKFDHYWDEGKSELKLGDFKSLVNFLITNSGKKDAIDLLLP